MKKRVMSMLMVMIMMVSMLSVSVFAHDGACTAASGAEWSSDASGHWHACADAACTVTDVTALPDYAAHADTAVVDGKCDSCGYELHKHLWSATDYDYNDTHHWNICAAGSCFVTAPESMYGYAAHTLEVDTTNTDTTKVVKKCACGYTVEEHAHNWATTLSHDANKHWYACTNGTCTERNGEADHVWVKDEANSTATNLVEKCECGEVKSGHVHNWETTYTFDDSGHWYKCTGCTDISGFGEHYDYNGTGICDAGDCNHKMESKTITSLTITGLNTPVDDALVDFDVTVAESYYGAPTVKWNRVVDLKKNTSVALGNTSTFAGGYMYNVSISVPMDFNDIISDDFKVTLDGIDVHYYGTTAAFEGAVKSYEGNNTVYMARHLKVSGQRYIIVSVMFPKLAGTHACIYGSEWVETPAKHYHLCSGCGATKDAEYHYDNNKSGLCDVCGFDMKYFNKNATANSGTGTGSGTHTHTYSTDWVEDISNHWKQCTGCGAKTQSAAHADLNNTGKCDVCGFVMTAAAGHTHTFATEWTETFAQHYKVCSCGAKNEIAAHADLNNTGKCDVCGYAMTTLSNNGIVADTGDHNATFLWMAAFAVSALGAGLTVVFARKKREE